MKKQILLAFSAVLILGLVIAAYAFNQKSESNVAASVSCPMKTMNADAAGHQEKTSCCDKDDCCCKGGSCPMKARGENAAAHSCPMKNKEEQASGVDMKNVTVVNGESCCNGGACCKDKQS